MTHAPELITLRTYVELSSCQAEKFPGEVFVGGWLAVAVAVQAVDWAGTTSTQALSSHELWR